MLQAVHPKRNFRHQEELREAVMSDREFFKQRAAAEREAAQAATDVATFRRHMEQSREYEWRAVTEPYPDDNFVQSPGQGTNVPRATQPGTAGAPG
jgi:hypothetical protein